METDVKNHVIEPTYNHTLYTWLTAPAIINIHGRISPTNTYAHCFKFMVVYLELK